MEFLFININEEIKLRALTPEVYKYAFKNLNSNELMAFFGCNTQEELARERMRYEGGLTTFNKTFIMFQIITGNNRNIGWCGFHTWYTDHARAEIGYLFNTDEFKNKGIMSLVLAKVIDYGFNEMNLHRIEAFVGPDNIPSLKLMEKFNFTKEGHLREHYFKNNKMEDSVVFSLLKSEYKHA